jgi:competence protein ComFB
MAKKFSLNKDELFEKILPSIENVSGKTEEENESPLTDIVRENPSAELVLSGESDLRAIPAQLKPGAKQEATPTPTPPTLAEPATTTPPTPTPPVTPQAASEPEDAPELSYERSVRIGRDRRLNIPHRPLKREPLAASVPSGGIIKASFSGSYRHPINLMQRIVLSHVGETLTRFGICDCDRCQAEASALVLNKIHSKYVSVFSPAMALEDLYYKKNYAELTSSMLLAAANITNAAWHRVGLEEPEEDLYLENAMERVVATIIKDMAAISPTCQCERCVGDISAFMLNDLPTLYRVGTRRELISFWVEAKQEYESVLVPLYEHYATRVAESPLH